MGHSEIDVLREKLLVMRVQSRESGAFAELVVQYERRVLYYVHRILGNDVELADVMQEIWIRVFLKISTLHAPQAFRVWLYKIAHDVSVSELRKSKRRETTRITDEHLGHIADTSAWHEFELLEHAGLVHEAIEHLSLPHREVLTLRFLEGLDLSELADVVGCSIGTVKSRLHYAKFAMRKFLEATCRE